MQVGDKYIDSLGRFSEYSIKGIKKKERKLVIQKTESKDWPYVVWYVYDVTKDLVTTVTWSNAQWKAEKKARDYIRELNEVIINA
jgi:hypothetical protein